MSFFLELFFLTVLKYSYLSYLNGLTTMYDYQNVAFQTALCVKMRINFFRFNYLSTVLWYVLKSRSVAKSLSSGYSHVHLISISHLQRDIHKLMVVRFLLLGAWTFKMYSIFVQCYETFIMNQIDWRFIQFLLYIFYF